MNRLILCPSPIHSGNVSYTDLWWNTYMYTGYVDTEAKDLSTSSTQYPHIMSE